MNLSRWELDIFQKTGNCTEKCDYSVFLVVTEKWTMRQKMSDETVGQTYSHRQTNLHNCHQNFLASYRWFYSFIGACIFVMPQNRVGEKHTKCVTCVHNRNAHKGKFHNRNAAKIHKWTQKKAHLYTHLQTHEHIAKYDVCLFHERLCKEMEISINQ